jgi:hypothetical protein
LLLNLAQGQSELTPILSALADSQTNQGDDQATTSLRNIDGHLARLLADQTSGRETAVQEIRSEIRLLARTIAALAEGEEPR